MGTINSPLHIFWAMNQMHLSRHIKVQNDRFSYIEMSQKYMDRNKHDLNPMK